jgi:methylmalonyl-CoA/ethylmalonyl-CoA epimerase
MTLRLDHVGIAVRSLDERLPFWTEALGLVVAGTDTVPTEGVRVVFLPAGEARLELLEPTAPDSPIARFLDKRGEGLQQIALAVDDVQAVLDRMRRLGLALLDEAPRVGAHGTKVAFLHPKATGGVLVELVERPSQEAARLEPGTPVLAYLRDPREKLWGVLRRLDAAGVALEGLDVASFDDWAAQVERGGAGAVGPSLFFLPMARVEKLIADRPSGDLPSMAERFRRRTGKSVLEAL